MSKVINLNRYLCQKHGVKGELSYERTEYYNGLLRLKLGIMDELFTVTEAMLRETGYEPSLFTLVEKSAVNYLKSDIIEFLTNGMEELSLSYEATIKGVLYRTYATASLIEQDNSIEVEAILLKKTEREWLCLLDGVWMEGPGDFFAY